MELNKDFSFSIDDTLASESFKYYDKEASVSQEMNQLKAGLDKNIEEQMKQLKTEPSLWEKVSQTDLKEILQTGLETALKAVLKKKLNINYSTFDDFKNSVSAVMEGNLKEFVKKGTDAALDVVPLGDAITKNAIKSIKNSVLDKAISGEKEQLVTRQTKVLNRLDKHCEEFQKAMQKNDVSVIKNKASAIQKDMKEIMPIREIIIQGQTALDQYELWKNKGEKGLTEEENQLIEKLNKSA